jgi:hypothetical protein
MLNQTGQPKNGRSQPARRYFALTSKPANMRLYTVLQKTEHAGGVQKVYNIVADGGSTLLHEWRYGDAEISCVLVN